MVIVLVEVNRQKMTIVRAGRCMPGQHKLCHVVLGLVLHCNTLPIDKRITEGLIANRVQVAVLERFIQQ